MNTGLFVDLRCTGSSSSGGSAPYACDACHSLTANFVMTLSGDLKERVIPRAVCPCERPRSHSGYCSGLLTTLSNVRASNQSLTVVLRATLCAELFIFPPQGYNPSGRTSICGVQVLLVEINQTPTRMCFKHGRHYCGRQTNATRTFDRC